MLLRIKEIRNKKNITQDDLAMKTGLSKRMILDYEKEIKDIPLQKLQLIATALECTLNDLIINDTPYKEESKTQFVSESSYQDQIIAIQKEIIEDLKKDKKLLTSLIETKLGNQEAS